MRVHRDLETRHEHRDEPEPSHPDAGSREETVVNVATQPAPSTTVVHHGPPARDVARHKARQAVWYFFGVMETLLALRVVLLALGANRANEFFVFLLGVTQPLVAPFANLIVAPRFDGAVLELSTIFAMVIYLLLAVAVARLLDLLLAHSEA